MATHPDDGRVLVRCDCGHLLAERWPAGGYNIIGTTRYYLDDRGRTILVCPDCKGRTRMPEPRHVVDNPSRIG